jgi:hypothetical protein
VRADRQDRALDLAAVTEQLHLDLLAGVVTFEERRDAEKSVCADERGEHAGAA